MAHGEGVVQSGAFQRDVGVGEGRKGLPSHPIESFRMN
jgi:hypothetical protein